MQFEVSDPRFHVDGDLNLVPHRDVQSTSPVLFIHGTSTHADDVADVEVAGWPVDSAYTLRVTLVNFTIDTHTTKKTKKLTKFCIITNMLNLMW